MSDRRRLGWGYAPFQRALLLSALYFSGCAVAVEGTEDEEVAVASQAILNGTTLATSNSGIVFVGPDTCSGTLLRNRWVLTAAHCINLYLDRDFAVATNGYYRNTQTNVRSTASSAAFDASGRLVIGGYYYRSDQPELGKRFYLRRYTSAGAVDTGFGVGGEVITDFVFSPNEEIMDIAIQSNGNIVAAGWSTYNNQPVIALARYTSSGAADTGFGVFGQVQTEIPSSAAAYAHAVEIDASGRPVIVGYRLKPDYTTDVVLARYTTSGGPDMGFDGDGQLISPVPGRGFTIGHDLKIDGSGRILVTGTASSGVDSGALVMRFSSLGALDNTFGTGGRTILPGTSVAPTRGKTLLLQGSQILIGGRMDQSAAVFRLTSAGALDLNFGAFGAAQPRFANQQFADTVGLALASDGRIRVAVAVRMSNEYQHAYAVLSANGGLNADRYFRNMQGFAHDNELSASLDSKASSIAVSGSRVVIAGVRSPNSSPSAMFSVLQPDRTDDMTFTDTTDGVWVQMANMPGQEGRVWADRAYIDPNNNDDVALLHLASPIAMNGSTTGYTGPAFYSGNFSALPGTDTTCKGYGVSALDGTGSGTLRQGTSRVKLVDSVYVHIGARPAPATAQYGLAGDSGSSCFSSANQILGVFVRRGYTSPDGQHIRASRFATWANGLIANP